MRKVVISGMRYSEVSWINESYRDMDTRWSGFREKRFTDKVNKLINHRTGWYGN